MESDEENVALATGLRESWMVTPLGSLQVMSMKLHNPVLPSLPPPSYYTILLAAENFNFPPSVVEFLQEIDAGPRALCKISTVVGSEAIEGVQGI